MIISRKMLKRVCESRHPCRTPTVVLNRSPVLPLNTTALWALSCRFSMARMMLALMCFLIVAHKASCHTLTKAFLVYEDMVEILLMLQVFLAKDHEIEYYYVVLLPALKPACFSAMIASVCGWSLFMV